MWINKERIARLLNRRREYRRINPSEKYIQGFLDRQAKESEVFADFICEAVRRKYPIVVRVEVDGVGCSTGIILPGGKLPEWLANWACAQQLLRKQAAENYRKGDKRAAFMQGDAPPRASK